MYRFNKIFFYFISFKFKHFSNIQTFISYRITKLNLRFSKTIYTGYKNTPVNIKKGGGGEILFHVIASLR